MYALEMEVTILPYPPSGRPGPLEFGLGLNLALGDGVVEPAPGRTDNPPLPPRVELQMALRQVREADDLPVKPIGPIFPHVVSVQEGIQLEPQAVEFTLKAGQMGYLQQRCSTGYLGAEPAREQLGKFHSDDESVAKCEFADVTQQTEPGICGGLICQQQFFAGEPGTTMVTNDRSNRFYKITVTK